MRVLFDQCSWPALPSFEWMMRAMRASIETVSGHLEQFEIAISYQSSGSFLAENTIMRPSGLDALMGAKAGMV